MENDLTLVSQPAAPMPDSSALQCGFSFPPHLLRNSARVTLDQFVGLEKARKIAAQFNRPPHVWRIAYVGPSGTGKTIMGLVIAASCPLNYIILLLRIAP